jgi:LEA14-like dessication related protein
MIAKRVREDYASPARSSGVQQDKESDMKQARNARKNLNLIGKFTASAILLIATMPGTVFATEMQAPAISIAGLHSPSFTAEGVQLICSVRVENPNEVALPLSGADINLKLAGTPAAKGRLLKNVTIPSQGIQNVDVLVDVAPAAAMTWLPMFFQSQAFTLPFEVDGYVEVDHASLGRVAFKESGDVSMTGSGLVTHIPDQD